MEIDSEPQIQVPQLMVKHPTVFGEVENTVTSPKGIVG
jgi:hypothetical protein